MISPDLATWAFSLAGTAALSLLAGREWGRRALRMVHPARSLVDEVCDAIADGTVTPDEAEEITLALGAVLTAAAEGPAE